MPSLSASQQTQHGIVKPVSKLYVKLTPLTTHCTRLIAIIKAGIELNPEPRIEFSDKLVKSVPTCYNVTVTEQGRKVETPEC